MQIAQRRTEARERELQGFHKLVNDLVSPDPARGDLKLDRQAAVVVELRHFPRYDEFTERMLIRCKNTLMTDEGSRASGLVEEMDSR